MLKWQIVVNNECDDKHKFERNATRIQLLENEIPEKNKVIFLAFYTPIFQAVFMSMFTLVPKKILFLIIGYFIQK